MEQIRSISNELFSMMDLIWKNWADWIIAGWIAVAGIWCVFLLVFGRRGAPSHYRR